MGGGESAVNVLISTLGLNKALRRFNVGCRSSMAIVMTEFVVSDAISI
jgi:hypothetical protein